MMILPTSRGKEFPEPTGSRAARPYNIITYGEGRAGESIGETRLKETSAGLVSGGPQPCSHRCLTRIASGVGREARREAVIGERRPENARPPTRVATATRSRPLLAPFTFRSPWTPYLFPPGSPSSRSSSSSSSAPRIAAAILRGGTRGTGKEGGNKRSPHWRTGPRRRRRKRHCHWPEKAGQPMRSQERLRVQPFGGGGRSSRVRVVYAQSRLRVPGRTVGRAHARQIASPGRGLAGGGAAVRRGGEGRGSRPPLCPPLAGRGRCPGRCPGAGVSRDRFGRKRPQRSRSPIYDPAPLCQLDHGTDCRVQSVLQHLQRW